MKKLVSLIALICLFCGHFSISSRMPWKEILIRTTLVGLPLIIRFQDAMVKVASNQYDVQLDRIEGEGEEKKSTEKYRGAIYLKDIPLYTSYNVFKHILFLGVQRGITEGIILNVFYSAIKNK